MLRARFGGPNGPLTFLGPKGGDPDGPFKWDYLFAPVGALRIQVIRGTAGIEIWWWGGDVTREDILAYFDANLDRYPEKIDAQIGKLEDYTLILNPYVRHRSMAKLAAEELAQLNPSPPSMPGQVVLDRSALLEQGQRFSEYINCVERQALYAMLLVTESAFAAEAYLNLLVALLARPEVRNSKTLLEETLRRRWREKLERLPIDCLHFDRSPDMGDSRVRDAKELFDLRNHIAHSYPDKRRMRIGNMWFQDRFPILPWAVPFHEFAFALSNQLPSVDEALAAKSASESFVEMIRDLLSKKIHEKHDLFISANPLGYNETKGIYGVPFGQHVIVYSGGA